MVMLSNKIGASKSICMVVVTLSGPIAEYQAVLLLLSLMLLGEFVDPGKQVEQGPDEKKVQYSLPSPQVEETLIDLPVARLPIGGKQPELPVH